jgi:hypothetical protein
MTEVMTMGGEDGRTEGIIMHHSGGTKVKDKGWTQLGQLVGTMVDMVSIGGTT